MPDRTHVTAYPRASYLAHQRDIDAAIARVLARGSFILGDEVAMFESEFAEFVGVASCAGVASGTDAIELALRACGVGDGGVVIAPSFTAVASVAAIERAGARAVLVDVERATLTIDVHRAEAALAAVRQREPNVPLALLAVHLYGCPADVVRLRELATAHDARLVEDCAQAHGARVADRRVGTWGDAAAFSFYPTKNLAALGDGGAVVAPHAGVVDRVRLLRQYGWVERAISETTGMNSRLDEMQAAVLRVKLRALDDENAVRRQHASVYSRELADCGLVLPTIPAGREHVFHQYVVRTDRRGALRAALDGRGIATGIHYPAAVHSQPAYRDRVECVGSLDESGRAARTVLSLPMNPHMSEAELVEICGHIRDLS